MKTNKTYLVLLVILLLALLIRIPLFTNEKFVTTDGVDYARLGKNLIEKGEYFYREDYNFGTLFSPGYPLFIGLTNLFFDNLLLSGRLVSLLSSLITIILLYFIGKELNNKEAGLFLATCYAIYPFIIWTSVRLMTESIFFLFLALTIYLFVLAFKRKKILFFLLFGASSAFAYLIRPEGIILLALPFLSLKKLKNKKYLVRIFAALLVFILVASPYLLFLKESTGDFTLSGKTGLVTILGGTLTGGDYEKLFYSLNEEKNKLDALEKSSKLSIIDFMFEDPVEFIKRFFLNSLYEIELLLLLSIPILLPLLFSFLNINFFKNKINLILLAMAFLFFILYPLFFVSTRFVLTITVILILLSSTGFTNSKETLHKIFNFYEIKKNKTTLFMEKNIKIIIVILLILSSLPYVGYYSFIYDRDITEYVDAAMFLKEMHPEYEEINVMARKPWISFYSGSKYTTFPYANYKDVINFAKIYGVDYIIVDGGHQKKWDNYEELMQMEKYSDEVELIYEDNSGTPIKILKVKKPILFKNSFKIPFKNLT
jgi:4-amino-4-deoxy-L-arabinose transferase-like glycosyltransferase